MEQMNATGALPDPDRAVHVAITALIEKFAAMGQTARELESLLHRVASMQGRLTYVADSVRAAWELSLGEEGMTAQHIAVLKRQMKLAVNS